MKRNDKQIFNGSFANLSQLASFILDQRLSLFVKSYFTKCSDNDAPDQNGLETQKQETFQVFRQSCEKWLQSFGSYSDEKLVQTSIEDAFEHELLKMVNNQSIIDNIVTINCIRAESLKEWVSDYTDNVSVALTVVKEIDIFISASNRLAFQMYSKQLISNLEVKNNTLRESNEKLKQFAAVVSHDLKAPLRKISLFLDLIHQNLTHVDSKNVSSYIKKTKNATLKMNQLIDNLLIFSTLDDQNIKVEQCDLQVILEEVIDNLEPSIKSKNAKIVRDKLPTIKAVSFQMAQLFQNLLANSLKFCKQNVPPIIQISNHIETKENAAYLIIEISDNCIGFKNEHSQKVFSEFTRLHSNYEGTGLGLSICKKIIENHSGSISVESEEGVGTVFHIELPLEMDHARSIYVES
jgi:signal transduction histidine kinase